LKSRSAYKNKGGLKQDDLRRRREEQQVEIRRQKREENISKRRNLFNSTVDSDDEGTSGTWEPQVSRRGEDARVALIEQETVSFH
jgi:importin subunit alpha-1